jgi:hypothetical protein
VESIKEKAHAHYVTTTQMDGSGEKRDNKKESAWDGWKRTIEADVGGETSNQPLHPAQTQALVVAAAAHDGIK